MSDIATIHRSRHNDIAVRGSLFLTESKVFVEEGVSAPFISAGTLSKNAKIWRKRLSILYLGPLVIAVRKLISRAGYGK